MTQTTQFPFVSVSGTPEARGRSYGQQAAARVRKSAAMYGQTLVELGYDAMARTELIAHFAREIEHFAPHYVEEMRGIAAGADVPFEDIVMVNARTEVVAKARADKKKAAELEPGDGCTGALILPTRSANGKLIHGQNWDWRAECAETAIVLRVRNDNGPDMLTFVEAGGLARSGLNSAGVSITANYLESDRDFRQLGVPLSLIRRKVLEQEHFALAIKAVATTAKSCSNNIMLGMAAGFGVDYECTTDEAFPIYPGSDDLIVHANHWVSEVALSKLRDTGRASTPESAYRDWRVRRLLNEKKHLTREDLKRALFDDFGAPYSVCRPPRPGSHDNLSATVAMVVMEPAAGLMEVAPLPALNRTFTRYSLTAEPELLAAA
ncbi:MULTISPECIES: C45 family autoproteolytic acyltransferase/hydolase [Achromobacter]|uniref:C45 family autoproteolytic acyltransferase/hydrolase n=1 Tax=Achromobacter spanius TaxID=217203 RepID=A0ABY8GT59_9BURK|nr:MULTISPECIES: C45 family peptidase [Achromobacter]WAI83002.1 C45 family autoproteolytic acyltransferase/hydrolase [Achromobacter spanius]WEX93088.1 C45 family autoproteolytic acyltransferase/hydrolase [Achromobacter sp. SS2-2022]WFP07758.1 C45 family autoproteolytic acyltransferase/hydrolase [Achromobacter spanius]